MRLKKFIADYDGKIFKIEEDSQAGAYLFVYEKNKCVYDYLQNTVKDCTEFANEEFKVPIYRWKENLES